MASLPMDGRRAQEPQADTAALAQALAPRGGDESLFQTGAWRCTRATSAAPAAGQHWLLLPDDCGFGSALATRLQALNVRMPRVHAAAGAEQLAADAFAVRAGSRGDHVQMLAALRAVGLAPPQVVLHLWDFTAQATDATQAEACERGFHSLLALGQALGEVAEAAPCHLAVVSNGLTWPARAARTRPRCCCWAQ